MKLRHAAAITLFGLGWCLMVPPESENAPYGNLNLEAPVSCWPQVGTIYPTQVSCQEFIKKLRADSRKDPNERKEFDGRFLGPNAS
jgi:hypothetical protein